LAEPLVDVGESRSHDHEAFFGRDGDRFVPRRIAKSAWGETVGGHIVGGLLGWAAELLADDPLLQPARLTVDLPRPTALVPASIQSRVLRDGKRLKLVEVLLVQDGDAVARASALFLRRCEQPAGRVWSPDVTMPPIPLDAFPTGPSFFARTYGWGVPVQNPDPGWDSGTEGKYTWLDINRPVVEGQELTAFTRAAMAGDVTAGLCNWGTEGLQFINADYTLTLSRLPDGPRIGLASRGHVSHDGIASGSAVLVDHLGVIGNSVSVALAHSGFRAPSQ
jgi:hypothetical protein